MTISEILLCKWRREALHEENNLALQLKITGEPRSELLCKILTMTQELLDQHLLRKQRERKEKVMEKSKAVSKYSAMLAAAVNVMKIKTAPTLGSFATPKGLTYRATGRSRLHAGHVREVKRRQRCKTFNASLRRKQREREKTAMRLSNVIFTTDNLFRGACILADTPPTTRQTSKYRRGLGLAICFKQRAVAVSNQKRIEELMKGVK